MSLGRICGMNLEKICIIYLISIDFVYKFEIMKKVLQALNKFDNATQSLHKEPQILW